MARARVAGNVAPVAQSGSFVAGDPMEALDPGISPVLAGLLAGPWLVGNWPLPLLLMWLGLSG